MFRKWQNTKNPKSKATRNSNGIELDEPPTIEPFQAIDWIICGVSEDVIAPQSMKKHLTAFKTLNNDPKPGEKSLFDYIPIMSLELAECNRMGKVFAGYMQEAELPTNASKRKKSYAEMSAAWNPYTPKSVVELSFSTNESYARIMRSAYELAHDLLSASFRASRYLSQEGFHEHAEEVLALGKKLAMGSLDFMERTLNAKPET
jgi:hypothetical protein